jgi:hypothetical protein
MTVELRNATGEPGYALLVFDRKIDEDRLAISVQNQISRLYLGPSVPGKTNWTPARAHFFTATRVSESVTETAFRIGPEITTFILNETTVEFATADYAVKEQMAWQGMLLVAD